MKVNEDDHENNLPPGFRFHPTDEELISCYLVCKVSDPTFTSKAVVDVDLNKCEPWDLPEKAYIGEKEWYFFNLRDRKYPTGLRTNRATEAGYWKTTGKDKEIYGRGGGGGGGGGEGGGGVVGMKKTLVFYKGRAPKGEKSNWVMHEYRLQNYHARHLQPTNKEEWVVCRVFKKSTTIKRLPTETPSYFEEQSPCDHSFERDIGNLSSTIQQNFDTNIIDVHHHCSNKNLINTNMDHLRSLSSWNGSTLLIPQLPMDSLLLKALQLKNILFNQPTITTDNVGNTNYSLTSQDISQFGMPTSDFNAASSSSSSKLADSSVPQTFNINTIW